MRAKVTPGDWIGYAVRTIGRRGALTLPCCGDRTRWSKRLTAPAESDPKPTKIAFPFATKRSLNVSTPRACCPCNQIETNTDIFPAINPGNPGLDVHLLLGMNPGMPVSTTGLSLTRVLIPSLISLIASSGRVEI
jgi:hypothetical protein